MEWKRLHCMYVHKDVSIWTAVILKNYTSREEQSWPWSYGSWIYNYLCDQCLSPLMLWVWISIRAMCTTLCDKVCQWLATGRWFSPVPPVSFTNKTDRHDIPEILLTVASNTYQTNKQAHLMKLGCLQYCNLSLIILLFEQIIQNIILY